MWIYSFLGEAIICEIVAVDVSFPGKNLNLYFAIDYKLPSFRKIKEILQVFHPYWMKYCKKTGSTE